MLPKRRFRLVYVRDLSIAAICVGAAVLFSIGNILPRVTKAEESRSVVRGESDIPPEPESAEPAAPEPIGEEADIFKERAKEKEKQQRREAKLRKKDQPPPTFKNLFTLTPIEPKDVGDGPGMISRLQYLNGPSLGRTTGITPLEILPYVLNDEHFFFADLRGFVSNRSYAGGNAGVGYRYLREDINAWGGASLWYDADQTSGKLFQQVGLSLEALISRFEWRGNAYLPVSQSQTFSNLISNERIVGNQLLYGQAIDQGTGLSGFDSEVGGSIPIRDRNTIRAFVGGYHFEGGGSGGVNGVKVRAEGVYNNGITAQVLYTKDNLYGSNVMVGCGFQLPFGTHHPSSGWNDRTPSPFRFVERNYNVIVSHQVTTTNDMVAINPATGLPYVIEQVQESGTLPHAPGPGPSPPPSPTPDGTTANPFATIADAQHAGGDVILVRSGSVINTAVVLTQNEHLIGVGGNITESLALAGGGFATVPNPVTGVSANAVPVFASITGPAVVLANNTEVGGFIFNTTTNGGGGSGDGVSGTNVSNISLHDLTFSNIGNDAIHLTGSSGNVTLSDIQINSATNNGIVIDGGDANITFYGLGNTITAGGDGFLLTNTVGGSVSLQNLTVKSTGLDGLDINNAATNVLITSMNATNTTGPAIFITGTTGVTTNTNGTPTTTYNTYNFNGFTNIVSPRGAGLSVNGTDALIDFNNLSITSTANVPAISLVSASSEILMSAVTLNTSNGTALYGRTLGDLEIDGGSITTLHGAAIDIAYSSINTTFGDISVNGGPFGISLAQSTGSFVISGNNGYGSGGTIQNIAGTNSAGLLINSFGNTNINNVDFTNNSVAVNSTLSSSLTMNAVRINGSKGYAIISDDDALLVVTNSIFATNGALGGGTILVQADATANVNVGISGNSITDTNGTAIQFITTPGGNGASLNAQVTSNAIAASFGGTSVVDVVWNGPVAANISNNTINAYGASMTGVFINDTSTLSSLTANVNSNTMTFAGSQSTGVSLTASGQSFNQLEFNTVNFNAPTGIGLRFSLGGTSSDVVIANVITDSAGGATGMLFDTIAANSIVQFDSNVISLLANDNSTHRGIIFNSVTPTIQFTGSRNNLIYNTTTTTTTFQIPVNSATGGFYINGVFE